MREAVWVGLDAVALLAFLPPEWILIGVSSARTLRLFRLVRLLLLFRLWAPMVVDLYTVLSRAERLRQVWLMMLAFFQTNLCMTLANWIAIDAPDYANIILSLFFFVSEAGTCFLERAF